ncbi:uncharacterized protein PG998_011303 [Apiospora kogelbergensis]|uniref:G-patch domain-containing protein n=1 Tax=Apiospora kogelbergensis TaxID=1337665 RepID=A0AAW0RC02_9PEZI
MPSTTKRKIDAHALLTSQGWRGKGHSLHPTNDATGLKHHILIKRDGNDGAGLGLKKDHKVEAWWMNAFDQALKGIDTTSGTMKRTAGGGGLDLDKIVSKGVYKYSGGNGLYSSFVKGGLLAGTVEKNLATGLLTPPESGVSTPAATIEGESSSSDRKETKEERRARRDAKKMRKAEKGKQLEADARAAAKAIKKAAKKVEKKKAKDALKAGETKEERRARRNARRTRKEEKRRLRAATG